MRCLHEKRRGKHLAAIPIFPNEALQAMCDVLADSAEGLTGSQIGTYLLRLDARDPGSNTNKRVRLYEALQGRQQRDLNGGIVVAFLHMAMDPLLYVGKSHQYETRRQHLNQALAACGYELRDDGKLKPCAAAKAHG